MMILEILDFSTTNKLENEAHNLRLANVRIIVARVSALIGKKSAIRARAFWRPPTLAARTHSFAKYSEASAS